MSLCKCCEWIFCWIILCQILNLNPSRQKYKVWKVHLHFFPQVAEHQNLKKSWGKVFSFRNSRKQILFNNHIRLITSSITSLSWTLQILQKMYEDEISQFLTRAWFIFFTSLFFLTSFDNPCLKISLGVSKYYWTDKYRI